MKEIFEKLVSVEKEGEEPTSHFEECSEEEATHIHYCYNDEGNGRACRRVAL
jgi:hypothetical protein